MTDPTLNLSAKAVSTLSDALPDIAERCVAAIVHDVPAYDRSGADEWRATIVHAVQLALAGFLRLAATDDTGNAASPMRQSLDGAYRLGKGEARAGRSMDALLAAYRIGARVAWRELSTSSVMADSDAATVGRFAELVFAYIDELSASSVLGHADELANDDRARARLASALIAGRDHATLTSLAAEAGWQPPKSLTAVVLPADRLGTLLSQLNSQWLRPAEDPSGLDVSVILVPDVHGARRARLLRILGERRAYVGCAREWTAVASSYRRAISAYRLELGSGAASPVDTDEHLVELIVQSDPELLEDLRMRVLAPLVDQRDATATKLQETLRSWVLHQGRRDDIAADVHVHPQTVRYRMSQLRDLYGSALNDPQTILELTVALASLPPERTA